MDFPRVSGTKKKVKRVPTKQTPAYRKNVPENDFCCERRTLTTAKLSSGLQSSPNLYMQCVQCTCLMKFKRTIQNRFSLKNDLLQMYALAFEWEMQWSILCIRPDLWSPSSRSTNVLAMTKPQRNAKQMMMELATLRTLGGKISAVTTQIKVPYPALPKNLNREGWQLVLCRH